MAGRPCCASGDAIVDEQTEHRRIFRYQMDVHVGETGNQVFSAAVGELRARTTVRRAPIACRSP